MQAEIRSIRVIRGQSLPFLAALVDPGSLLGRSVSEWSVILAQARATRLLHRLAVKASDAGVLNDLPEPARTILAAAVDEWHVRNQRSR
ncbi:MAG: hypothetical protein ISS35_08605, partial [Kiritimatiellae bacterium]|nr:hypothetical protein [Kiritimatiellia bacterium]